MILRNPTLETTDPAQTSKFTINHNLRDLMVRTSPYQTCLPRATSYTQHPSHDKTLSSSRRLIRFLAFLHLRNHHLKRLAHINVLPRTTLDPATLEPFAQVRTLLARDLSRLLPDIVLIPHHHQRHLVRTQMIQDLVPDDADHLKALFRADGIDNHVAVDADEVFRVENRVFVLASGVDDLGQEGLAFV